MDALQTLFPKGPTGGGFEVTLEIKGLLAVPEGKGCLDFPRFELGRMRILAGIVVFQAGFKVFGESGVETCRVTLRLENVDVEKRISLGGGELHEKQLSSTVIAGLRSSSGVVSFSWRAEP